MRQILAFLLLSISAFAQSPGVGSIWTVVTGTLQSGATANGNGTSLALRGLSAAQITINCSVACSGGTTINFEVSEDGTNFSAINGQQLGTNTISATVVNQGVTPTIWEVNVAGLQTLRARISAYSAGTITITATAIAAPFDPKVINSNLLAGTQVIGHVIADTGSTTAVTGNPGVSQSGTWTVQPGNTANTTAWKVDGSAVTQPVSGTVTTTPPSNASTNVAQVAGTTADTNSGTKSAGTLRVVLATDQPALTNKLLVTPDSVALPANQSVNVAQVAGTTTDTNSGTKSAGTIRVVLATDQPALTNKLLVTADPITFASAQAVTQSGNWTGRVVGNTGATVDSAPAATAPTNVLQVGGTFSTTPTTLTNGQAGALELDAAQNLLVNLKTAIPAGSNAIGTVQPGNTANTTPWLYAPATEATTANSALTSYLTSAASTNSTSVKGSAGNVYGISVVNTTSTLYYLRMYNSSSAPTCSSATGFVESIPAPHNTGNGGGISRSWNVPQGYTTGIGFCITGGGSSTDNTSAATGLYLTIIYK